MSRALEQHLRGEARRAIHAFYDVLPSIPRREWPALMHGMGYNFEHYDALFAMMIANLQMALDDCDYTARHRAVQLALLPFCSEYGIELKQDLQHNHRHLYGDFYRAATGESLPERYPPEARNRWLAVSRRWAVRMRDAIACRSAGDAERARYNLGYYWAVEHLSIDELATMREAWNGLGVQASYLDAHCAVEEDHNAYAARAVLAFTTADDATVAQAIHAHEADLAGYYDELTALARA
jgi:heme oxygenase-like protein